MSYRLTLLFLCSSFFVSAQSADELFKAGQDQYYNFQYTASRAYFEQALQGYFPLRKKQQILECFYYISMGYYEQGDIDNALDFTIQAMDYGEEQFGEGYSQLAPVNILLGKLYHYNESYDSAALFYLDAISHIPKEEKSLIAGEANINLGYAYDFGEEYQKALDAYFTGVDILQVLLGKQHVYMDWVYASIPYPATKAGNYELALDYSIQSLEIKRVLWGENNQDEADALQAVAVAYEYLDSYSKAWEYMQQALIIYEKIYSDGSLEIAEKYATTSNILAGNLMTDKALTYAEKSYQIRRKVLGKTHEKTYDVFQNIGNINFDAGRFQAALEQYSQAEKMLSTLDNPKASARLLFNLANTHEMLADFEKMKIYLDRTMEVQRTLNDPGQVTTTVALARHAFTNSNYRESLRLLAEADELRLQVAPLDKELEAFILNNRGTVYRNISQFGQAQAALKKALTIRRKNSGEESSAYNQTLTNYGLMLIDLGLNVAARDSLTKAMETSIRLNGPEHPELAEDLLNLSIPFGNLGQVDKEIELLEQVKSIRKTHFDSDHPSFISVFHNLALSLSEIGRYQEALDYIQKAKPIIVDVYGTVSLEYARNLINEQKVLSDQGNRYGSIDLQKEAIEIYKTVYESRPTKELALAYNNIGASYLKLDENEQAILYLDLAIDMYAEIFDESHPSTFITRYNKAQLLYNKSRYDDALAILEENIGYIQSYDALDVKYLIPNLSLKASCFQLIDQKEKARDIYHSALNRLTSSDESAVEVRSVKADLLNNLGAVSYSLQDYEQTKTAWEEARDLYTSIYQSPSYPLAHIYNNLADLYRSTGDYDTALKMLAEADEMNLQNNKVEGDIMTYFLTRVKQVDVLFELYESTGETDYLSKARPELEKAQELLINTEQMILSDEDKVQYSVWKSLLTFIGIKNAYYLYEQTQDEKYIQEAFDYAEVSKSNVLYQSMDKSNVKDQKGVEPKLFKKQKELEQSIVEVRDELFKKHYKNIEQQAYINAIKERLIDLNEQLRSVNSQIAAANSKRLSQTKQLQISELQQTLGQDELLIEYAMSDDRLFTLLISKEHTEILLVPYSDTFSNMVTAFRNAIYYQQASALKVISKKIADLIWKPIDDQLKAWDLAIHQVSIVPEGPLNYLPFEALSFNDKYLLETYAINYTYSAKLQHWIQHQETSYEQESLLAFAPVFSDQSISKMTDGAKDVFAASRHFSSETTRGFTVRGDFISPLPATASEVTSIHSLATQSGTASKYYLQKDASESQLKEKLKEKYQYLHFATHGFVNEAIPEYSGVFLSQQEDNGEDCILFASEIYTMDIPADLVTLSACETGLGKYAQGEGIVGLTRAFLYAGTKNLLVSQWQVDDASTSALMISFYENLFDGASKTEALREAKLKLLEKDNHQAPYYWAPFLLVGE